MQPALIRCETASGPSSAKYTLPPLVLSQNIVIVNTSYLKTKHKLKFNTKHFIYIRLDRTQQKTVM